MFALISTLYFSIKPHLKMEVGSLSPGQSGKINILTTVLIMAVFSRLNLTCIIIEIVVHQQQNVGRLRDNEQRLVCTCHALCH